MSFSLFLVATLLASVAALVALLAMPEDPGSRLLEKVQPLHGLRLRFGADDLLD